MRRSLRLLLGAVGLLVILLAAWFLLLSPLRQDIAAADEAIAIQRERVSSAQAKLAAAKATEEEGKKNQARLLELAKMVPDSQEMPSLLLQIQDLADRSGITFISVTPGSPVQSDDFRILPLEVEFEGTFFDLTDFVFRAEQMVAGPGRLLTVKSIDLKLNQQEAADISASPALSVSIVLYAFDRVNSATNTAQDQQAPDSTDKTDESARSGTAGSS